MNPFHFFFGVVFMADSQTTVEQKPSAAVPPAAQGAMPGAALPGANAPANASKGPPKRVLIVVGLIALAAIVAGGRMWYRSTNFVDTENAYVSGHLHPVSGRIPGVVTKVLFDDNQMVKA